MPKYDAFGREIGEDTLSGWREGERENAESAADVAERATEQGIPFQVEPAPPPPPPPPVTAMPEFEAPAPQPTFTAPPPPPPPQPTFTSERIAAPPRPRRRRRGPRVVSLLVVVVCFVIGINVLVSTINVGGLSDKIDELVPEVSPAVPDEQSVAEDARPPAGLQRGSMIRPGELRKALATLEGKGLSRAFNLRVAPDRIDAQMIKARRMHALQLTFDGGSREFSVSGPSFGHLATYDIGKLNPAAPQRLVRTAARRIGKSPNQINYLVASATGWNAYFKGGQYFEGDKTGRVVRRIG